MGKHDWQRTLRRATHTPTEADLRRMAEHAERKKQYRRDMQKYNRQRRKAEAELGDRK